MSWDSSDRRSELPPDWNQIRARVLKRDGHRCRWILPSGARCPRRATEVDHDRAPDDHRESSLKSLCPHHHQKKTQREAWVGRTQKKGRHKRIERPPGEVR